MAEESTLKQQHALEAIVHDTVSFISLFQSILNHPKMGLLIFGMLPPASMYVVESYRALKELAPDVAAILREEHVNLLSPSRHRAKLLDHPERSIDQISADFAGVAKRQIQYFMAPHTGVLGSLRRAIQPDLGLSTYNGHIFATTHASAFNFDRDHDLANGAVTIGKALGEYTATLLNLLSLPMPEPVPSSRLQGAIEMRDIKSSALYERGSLGKLRTELAAGMTFLLANLNHTHYIMQKLLPTSGLTQFRLKFIVAYHADSNLRFMQNRLASDSLLHADIATVFREVFGNSDSRWLRKRTTLRNILVHYMVEERQMGSSPLEMNRVEVIEHFGGELTYKEMDTLLDRHIERMSHTLEKGFALGRDPFWYGRVT